MNYLPYFAFLLIFFEPAEANSQTLPRDANLREYCRKQVAGKYLSLYDTHEKTEAYLSLLQEKKKQLEQGLIESRKKLSVVKKNIASSGYDIDLSDKHDSVVSRVSMIEDSLNENKRLRTDAMKKQKRLAKEIANLKGRISHIFNFKKIKGKGRGKGYKFQIEYKDTCPPYRFSCPLPREKAQKLLEIFPKGKIPIVCERYASFLNW